MSVVIPSYNTAAYIGETLASVFAQTQAAHEVVVVDDGSSDDSIALLERYEAIRLVRQAHAGIGAARNRGAREATGDYLLFLDGDDLLERDAIATQLAVFARHPDSGFVGGEGIRFDEDGVFSSSLLNMATEEMDPHRRSDGESYGRYHVEFIARNPLASVGQALIRRDAFERVGGFAERSWFSEDLDLWLRISKLFPVTIHAHPVLRYRHRNTAFSGIDDERMIRWAIWRMPVFVSHMRASPELRDVFAARLDRNVREGSALAYYYGRRFARWRALGYLARMWWCAPWLLPAFARMIALLLPDRVFVAAAGGVRKLRQRRIV